MNIPTVGTGSCRMKRNGSVKKSDKSVRIRRKWESLPKLPFHCARFSKIGQGLKSRSVNRMGEISTFQATTTAATSICFFFMSFLEAVSTWILPGASAQLAQKQPRFPQRNLSRSQHVPP